MDSKKKKRLVFPSIIVFFVSRRRVQYTHTHMRCSRNVAYARKITKATFYNSEQTLFRLGTEKFLLRQRRCRGSMTQTRLDRMLFCFSPTFRTGHGSFVVKIPVFYVPETVDKCNDYFFRPFSCCGF